MFWPTHPLPLSADITNRSLLMSFPRRALPGKKIECPFPDLVEGLSLEARSFRRQRESEGRRGGQHLYIKEGRGRWRHKARVECQRGIPCASLV